MTKFTEKRITAEVIEETANYVARQLQFALESLNGYADDSSLADWEIESKAETKARVEAHQKILAILEKL